jgi:hypothetical protein
MMPRWLLALEAVLFVGALGVLAYKAAMWIRPLPVQAVQQKRVSQKPPAQPTIIDYYRKYPDRYIRVENEVWRLDRDAKAASHSFSLRNLAVVAYADIEVRISYGSADGKVIKTFDMKIQGPLQGQATREFKSIKVPNVPLATKDAVITVLKGRIQ